MPWKNAATVMADYGIKVTEAQLATARAECLRSKGLALGTAEPPSEPFQEGVAMQALANRLATQANVDDESGSQQYGVRLYPFCKAIVSKLIIPAPSPDDPTRDSGFVGSLVG